jgi:hypothetical protein
MPLFFSPSTINEIRLKGIFIWIEEHIIFLLHFIFKNCYFNVIFIFQVSLYLSRVLEFTHWFLWGSCGPIFSFLCRVFSTFVCLFVLHMLVFCPSPIKWRLIITLIYSNFSCHRANRQYQSCFQVIEESLFVNCFKIMAITLKH